MKILCCLKDGTVAVVAVVAAVVAAVVWNESMIDFEMKMVVFLMVVLIDTSYPGVLADMKHVVMVEKLELGLLEIRGSSVVLPAGRKV